MNTCNKTGNPVGNLSYRSRPWSRRRVLGRIRSTGKGSDDKFSDMDGTNLQRAPREIVQTLEDKVFSLDTFFVQRTESYGDDGIVFKGNIRQNPSRVQNILQQRIQENVPGYKIFILPDREDKPTAVVIPESSLNQNSFNEEILCLFLSLATFVTTLNVYDAEIFNAALLTFNLDPDKIGTALPATLASLSILGAHELGHFIASKQLEVDLGPPLPLPAGLGLLGSFGSITNIKSDIQNRDVLGSIIVPGPILGLVASFTTFFIGLVLTMQQQGGVELDSASFRESFLVGNLASTFLGKEVFDADSINCNPLFVVGWGGLIVNAINLIPVGELDGGKISLAVFGRQWSQVLSLLSFVALGVGSFVNGLALFWLLFVISVQRGPGTPCLEEISRPSEKICAYAIPLLFVPLLILLPSQIN